MPLISIVVPAYNAASFLQGTIKSVQNQTLKDWELLLIDDGSQDETAAIVKPFLSDPRIRYVRQDNQERAVARNRGISDSSGEYVAFLDADDLWYPEKLALQLELMQTERKPGMCYTFADVLRPGEKTPRSYRQPMAREGKIFEDLLRGNFITVSSTMVRRNVLEEVGQFDTDSSLLGSEDWDLWLRISRRYTIGVVRKYLTTYRTHPGIQSHSKIFQGALGVLNKHFSDNDFVSTTQTPRRHALSYAYLSAASFAGAPLSRMERTRLLAKSIRLNWAAPFTPAGVSSLARILLPESFVSWIQQSRTAHRPADMRS